MKNPLSYFGFDSKTTISLGIVCLLSLFFSKYLFYAVLSILFLLIVSVCKNSININDKLKSIINNLAIILISSCVILLCIEGYLRWFNPKILQIGVNITGDLSDFKERGYLNEKIFHKSETSFRILGLGDSFARNLTWTKKNYHDILEQDFVKAGETHIEVVNAGMENTGPGYYWHILKKYGDSFKPNLVLVGFFVGNDFEDMDFRFASLGPYGIIDYVNPGEKIWRFLRFSNWWLYQFVQKQIIIFHENRSKYEEVKHDIVKKEATFSNKTFFDIQKTRLWIFEKKERDHLKRKFYSNVQVFLNFKKWCDARNVELVITIFPDQLQVDTQLLNEISTIYNLAPNSIDLSFPNQLVAQFLEQNHIHCLDMLPEFVKQSRSTTLYRINDTHWNEEGNKLAAETILSFLRQHQMVPVN
jgi:hypothetical protein